MPSPKTKSRTARVASPKPGKQGKAVAKSTKTVTSQNSAMSKVTGMRTVAVHLGQDVKALVLRGVRREKNFLKRRPHRTFRLTSKRDYERTFVTPGYWSFTNYVRRVLWTNKKTFGILAIVYVAISFVISGVGAQETYVSLADTLKQTSGDLFDGNIGSVGKASLLLAASVTTSLSPDVTQAQTVLASFAVFFAWLVTIWLLRNILAGNKPTVRDGLYNGGSPILSTVLIGFVAMAQTIPIAVALIVYSAADSAGMLEGGVSAMLAWSAILLMGLLSIYWLSSTILALVIVALPGMYPMQALRVAGDLVVGRRLRMIFRYIWMGLLVAVVWLVVLVPAILLDDWLNNLVAWYQSIPVVPFLIIVMSSFTLIFMSSYVYLLYRKLVDVDTGAN